jgi:hypothetical protein
LTEWLVEEGVGEHRAVLTCNDRIIAARLHWPGALTAGQVEDAKLVSRTVGSPRGIARFANGEEAHVDRLPPSASEGGKLRLEVARPAMLETSRRKLAQARPTSIPLRGPLTLADQLATEGHFPRAVRRFPASLDWSGLWAEASQGHVTFAGGTLLFYATPAMTLIDIDGEDQPFTLAKASIPPLADALRRFDLGGNIGIDFPTLREKAQRKAIDGLLDDVLADWPNERTAMNGFGFVQVVARMTRASVLALLTHNPAGAEARRLLREAEGLEGAGALALRCPTPVAAAMRQDWLDDLARRTGRRVRLEAITDRLDHAGGSAQLVPHE